MEPGAILRLRNIRDYGLDPRNWSEFRPDDERAMDLKKVFVCVLLGTEHMQICNKKGEQVMARLDITRVMNAMGWYSGEQLDKAKAPKKFLERLGKVVKGD